MLRRTLLNNNTRLVHSSARNQIDIVSGGVILFTTINLSIKLADLAQAKWDERNGKKPSTEEEDDHGHH